MKTYMTNEQLIDYLISKNVIVKNRNNAIRKIEKFTYYSIVNTYKLNFKDKNNNYLPNVSFDEIFALYEFDKNLKYIMLKYILEIENIIKSLMANQISSKYGIANYLNINNLDNNISSSIRQDLLTKIQTEITKNYKVHSAVTHYLNEYGFIPPFVLTKVLTLGVVSRYYGLLKQSDRQEIAKYFGISDKLLKQFLQNITIVRNICAHSDRLFTYRNKYTLSFKIIDCNYKPSDNSTNLYMIICYLKLFLDKRKYNSFVCALNKEIKKLDNKLFSIGIKNILKVIGYPKV